MTRRRIVLATRSVGKLAELGEMAEARGLAVVDLAAVGLAEADPAEEELECEPTFEGNALAKARWFAARLPGELVVADDSGLEVAALGGAPGVRSKRWSGSSATGDALYAENNRALLRALDGVSDRAARFVTVMAAVRDREEWVERGECTGWILEAAQGTEGFGYDPLFWSEELGASFGSVGQQGKAEVSHRARAFAALLAALSTLPSPDC